MAVHRPTPKCPYCGAVIAKGIYRNQSKIPVMMRLIGDTFIRWEYIQHSCKGKKQADKEIKKAIEDSIEEMKKKGVLPPFMKP